MSIYKSKLMQSFVFSLGLVLLLSALAFAQDNQNTQDNQNNSAQTSTASGSETRNRTTTSGGKMKIKGIIVKRDADTFTLRDQNGADTIVRLTDTTRVTERKSNPFRRAKNYGTTNLLRGLSVEVEGRSDTSGQLTANKIAFSEQELKVARSIESRVDPVENRVGTAENRIGQVEQNAERLSGQLNELAEVSNAARGGAVAAQATADAAVAGVNTTNERISALDDYVAQKATPILFKVRSAVLSPEAKAELDNIAKEALAARGYVIEVSGHASADGSTDLNRRLSQQRADAVVRYLAEQHQIPLRRIITPFGYGESQSVADNTTREGRAQNRRVDVKILVNRGLTQPAPNMNPTKVEGATLR